MSNRTVPVTRGPGSVTGIWCILGILGWLVALLSSPWWLLPFSAGLVHFVVLWRKEIAKTETLSTTEKIESLMGYLGAFLVASVFFLGVAAVGIFAVAVL